MAAGWAESEVGKGTTFIFTIEMRQVWEKAKFGHPPIWILINEKYILLTEDNPDDVTLTRIAFRRPG